MKRPSTEKRIRRMLSVMVWRFLPPCKDVVQTISDSLDRDLKLRERIVMKIHIMACRACERFLKQSEFIGSTTQMFGKEMPESANQNKLSSDAKERLKNALKTSAKV